MKKGAYYLTLFLLIILSGQKIVGQESILIVSVDIQPEQAKLFIDGKEYVRSNNGTVELTKGSHQVSVQCLGYHPQTKTIKVSRKKVYFDFTLQRDPSVDISLIPVAKEVVEEEIVSSEDIVITEDPIEVKDIQIEMLAIKGNSYLMGRIGRNTDKKIHDVRINDFSIGKYEVTQEQWEAVMGNNPSKFKGADLPVENVSWNDVQEFILKLNQKTGMKYRLPTEAEWEYAARGGDQSNSVSSYATNQKIGNDAWYWRNSGDSILSGRWDNEMIKKNHCQTKAVGQKNANKYGIYDMSGNVWEWCSDWYAKEYYNKSPLDNPKGPSNGDFKVYRGGSWVSSEDYCHFTFRFSNDPEYGFSYLGFRLVLDK
ncbi:MAG: SUMF1/EgtB/PvdO family nonheme iron enzyme [Bacteroidales bacterium]|nr:SUMF1/EgtB/PvdO family nonheme iron enzyme [Bacteroidales bacterium]